MLLDAFARLGITAKGRRWGPCPSCGEACTSRGDSRPPLLMRGSRWRCLRCEDWGDALDAVSLRQWGAKGRMRDARRWLGLNETIEVKHVAPPPPEHPPADELRRLLGASVPVQGEALEWLRGRDIPTAVGARSVRSGSKWWPWAREYPIVMGAYDGLGRLKSIHGRRISGSGPKTRWPKGYSSRGLVLGTPTGVAMLRQELTPTALVIAEGLTDTLWAAARAGPDIAVLGYESGSLGAIQLARIPESTRIYCATDPDGAGDKYSDLITQTLYPRPVARLPLQLLDA